MFYCIASWTTRKAMADTVEAYLDAFTAADPVVLYLKTGPVDSIAAKHVAGETKEPRSHWAGTVAWTLARMLGKRRDPPNVHLDTGDASRLEILGLHARGDCFGSLTPGEAWGICSFEAAWVGTPCIITGWGGPLEYLGEDYPLYVGRRIAPTAESEPDLHTELSDTARWAYADRSHASELMRSMVSEPERARRIGGTLRRSVTARFARARLIDAMVDVLGLRA